MDIPTGRTGSLVSFTSLDPLFPLTGHPGQADLRAVQVGRREEGTTAPAEDPGGGVSSARSRHQGERLAPSGL